MKVKEIKYERLTSDPYGYHNTRIGMIADLDETEDPIKATNKLRRIVNERITAYNEIKEQENQARNIVMSLNHLNNNLQQLRLDEVTGEKIEELKQKINNYQSELESIKGRINEILGE